MAGIPFHPAPGLGDLLPGWWDVPQNPVTARRGITKTPGIGEIIDAYFVVPQNPILDACTGNVTPLGQKPGIPGGINAPKSSGISLSGLGCGGACGCGGSCGGHGLGQVSTAWNSMVTDISAGNWSQAGTDFGELLTAPTLGGLPLWVMLIGGFFLVQMMFTHEVQMPLTRRAPSHRSSSRGPKD